MRERMVLLCLDAIRRFVSHLVGHFRPATLGVKLLKGRQPESDGIYFSISDPGSSAPAANLLQGIRAAKWKPFHIAASHAALSFVWLEVGIQIGKCAGTYCGFCKPADPKIRTLDPNLQV